MSDADIINGTLRSPYSMRMRAVYRYRGVAYRWVYGTAVRLAEARAKMPATAGIEYPDREFRAAPKRPITYQVARPSDRSSVPPDPAKAFLAFLIEEFADEWLAKAMFGYRCLREIDHVEMSRWLACNAFITGGSDCSRSFAADFRARQFQRMEIVGSTEENFPFIEASTRVLLDALEIHVGERQFPFGTRPSLADFGLYGQLSQLWADPDAQAMMVTEFPNAHGWLLDIGQMSVIDGEWDGPETPIRPPISQVLHVIGEVYLPFLLANAAALAEARETFTIEALGHEYSHSPLNHPAECLADLRVRYVALDSVPRAIVDPILDEAGCLAPLRKQA